MKNQKGISLISLSIAVIVILAIAGTVLYNVRTNLGIQKVKSMQADIENLMGKVTNYYLQYGELPVLNVYSGGEKQNTLISKNSEVISDLVSDASSVNYLDIGDYYVIDLSAMENITLTYGQDYETLKSLSADKIRTLNDGELTDVYIINSVSHNIFYVAGIKYEGKTYYTKYQEEEIDKIGVSNIEIDLDNMVEKNEGGNVRYIIYEGERAPGNRNAIYKDENENVAVIPAGYTVSSVDGENTIENGLVVRDDNQNEWVWIPVSANDLKLMYSEATTNTDWKLGETNVITKYESNGNIISGITRGNPSSTDYREPDVLIDADCDKNQVHLNEAGFSSYENMAKGLRDDYKMMIESVKENGGFYVGRYELSEVGTQKNQVPLTDKNWYELYAKCKSIGNNKVETRMILGCQWDQVCKFISTSKDENGDTISLTYSTNYGNYWDFNNSVNGKINTGSNNKYKTNNIYDLAGNCWEWTQESYLSNVRVYRGGCYANSGSDVPVIHRSTLQIPNISDSKTTSRAVLYIK